MKQSASGAEKNKGEIAAPDRSGYKSNGGKRTALQGTQRLSKLSRNFSFISRNGFQFFSWAFGGSVAGTGGGTEQSELHLVLIPHRWRISISKGWDPSPGPSDLRWRLVLSVIVKFTVRHAWKSFRIQEHGTETRNLVGY